MSGHSIRVATFNIRFPSDSDEGNLWQDRRLFFPQTLDEIGADIIGMQEVYRSQLGDILDDSSGYAALGRERWGASDEEHSPILFRANRFLVEATGTFWLSETPDIAGSRQWMPEDHPRVVTWARFMDLHAGRRLLIANTHLPLGSDELRVRCATLIRERLDSIDLPMILTGDFNSRPSTTPYRVFTDKDPNDKDGSAAFSDAWEVCTEQVGSIATFHRFTGTPVKGDARIDWILVRNGVRVERVETIEFSVGGRYPSDHFPVVANIEIECDEEGL
jgi:endonuclease/exonuclease/phosphatase family metal-dependent hydrolase